ncbi:MAG TPA: hypothetical protein VLE02_01955 [Nitrosarchaeum sp.]|nr:hypothetical protein [Nitrosarchaeum sp.]
MTEQNLIRVEDAVAMFKNKITNKDPKNLVMCKKKANELLEMWKSKVLNHIHKDGMIPAIIVYNSINIFLEGTYAKCAMNVIPLTNTTPDEKYASLFKMIYNSNIEDLADLGIPVLRCMWDECMQRLSVHIYSDRCNSVYLVHEDPLMWEQKLNTGKEMGFYYSSFLFDLDKMPHSLGGYTREQFSEMNEKLKTIFSVPFHPTK